MTLEFIQMYIKDGQGKTEAKSDDEPEAEAVRRRIQEYFYEAPHVADYFGLVEPQLKRINTIPEKPSSLRGYWNFNERYVVTEKGRKMWEDLGLPINETAIPLAKHEFIEITGITKKNEIIFGMIIFSMSRPIREEFEETGKADCLENFGNDKIQREENKPALFPATMSKLLVGKLGFLFGNADKKYIQINIGIL